MEPLAAFTRMLNETAKQAKKVDDGLAEAAEAFTIDVYKKANGVPSKVPTYKQFRDLMYNRAKFDGDFKALPWEVDAHHTATVQWAKRLLEKLPNSVNYTKDDWDTLFDSMPAAALSKAAHGTVSTMDRGGTGFHEILLHVLPKGPNYDQQAIFNGLQKAYEDWDSTNGPKVWAVAKTWLEDQIAKGVAK
jgi:hypothetical protein